MEDRLKELKRKNEDVLERCVINRQADSIYDVTKIQNELIELLLQEQPISTDTP